MDYEQTILKIATRIRTLRISKNMTIQELAYRCDMERSNMSRIETGKINLTVKTLCKICNALEITLFDLVNE